MRTTFATGVVSSLMLSGPLISACAPAGDGDEVTAALFDGFDLGAHLTLSVDLVGTYRSGLFDQGAAEIVAHDPRTQRLFVVNAASASLDVLDIRDPSAPALVANLTFDGSHVNSVDTARGLVAVAVEATVVTDPGRVVFLSASTLAVLASVEVGVLPDMLTFTPNGRQVLVANEGQPSNDYTIDPEGTVSLINLPGHIRHLDQGDVTQIGFGAFNGAALDPSIRIYGPGATVAQDLEPEYITVSHDSRTAWVSLQENNALAVIDLRTATVTNLLGLGFKDHAAAGNEIDASDKDKAVSIRSWPVSGMYQPDGLATLTHRGRTFIVTANEGDARAYAGFNEEGRVKDVTLDPTAFPDGATLRTDANMGRLRITKANGDTDGDGDFDRLFSYGSRSFSIRTAGGGLVWDSGSEIERHLGQALPTRFNASHTNNTFDDRSDDKGPEPEGVAVGRIGFRQYAFIGLERMSGVMVYDVTNPVQPSFVTYASNRNFDAAPTTPEAGDLGPEGIIFIARHDSPTGWPLLVTGNEVSGTTSIYEIRVSRAE